MILRPIGTMKPHRKITAEIPQNKYMKKSIKIKSNAAVDKTSFYAKHVLRFFLTKSLSAPFGTGLKTMIVRLIELQQ